MGILGNQRDRSKFRYEERHLIAFLNEVKNVAKSTGLSVDQILKAYEIKEHERRTNAYIENGDYKDEQMGGFGELLEEIKRALWAMSKD